MRNFTIVIVLVFFTGITYWGIEPYAHSIMHPHVSEPDYNFKDLDVNLTAIDTGDAELGKTEFVNNCNACHSMKKQDLVMLSDEELIAGNGLLPPDLSDAGTIFNEKFLFAFLKHPSNAAFESTYVLHRKEALANEKEEVHTQSEKDALILSHSKAIEAFKEKKAQTYTKMPSFDWLSDKQVGDLIAFFRSVATPVDKLSGKEITDIACVRCHSVDYDKTKAKADLATLPAYLGSMPPDLSQMIKSKGGEYLHKFINDPQKLLLGTGMPRVGITKEAENKVVSYIEKIGDPHMQMRQTIGKYAVLFFLILSVFAFAWKKNEYEDIESK